MGTPPAHYGQPYNNPLPIMGTPPAHSGQPPVAPCPLWAPPLPIVGSPPVAPLPTVGSRPKALWYRRRRKGGAMAERDQGLLTALPP